MTPAQDSIRPTDPSPPPDSKLQEKNDFAQMFEVQNCSAGVMHGHTAAEVRSLPYELRLRGNCPWSSVPNNAPVRLDCAPTQVLRLCRSQVCRESSRTLKWTQSH